PAPRLRTGCYGDPPALHSFPTRRPSDLVKPFVKRQKNDAADAEAICEAAQRPSMRFVPVKSEEQQANGIVFRARDLLVHQRTKRDRKSTRLNSSHLGISYAVFCLKKKNN